MLDNKESEEINLRKEADGSIVAFCVAITFFITGIGAFYLSFYLIFSGHIPIGVIVSLVAGVSVYFSVKVFMDWCRANPNNLFSKVKKV